jgi:peroxiredoxin
MSSQNVKPNSRGSGRQANRRAQRRAAERQALKQRTATPQRGLPTTQLIGGLLTIVAVVIIIAYAVFRSNSLSHKAASPPSNQPALTVPADLHPAGSMLQAGQAAPNFTLKDVQGHTYNLASQRGHTVLLEFFAVWCPHCQHEAATIERLKLQYQPQGVRLWSILANPYGPNYDISYGQDTTLARAKDLTWFSNKFGEHLPQLVDRHFNVVNKYGITGYPGIYVIDKHGKIVYSQSGDQPFSDLAKAINSAQREK